MNNHQTIRLNVSLGDRSYPIVIGAGLQTQLATELEQWIESKQLKLVRQALVITDHNVVTLHAESFLHALRAANWDCKLAIVEAGEVSKSLLATEKLYDQLVQIKANRQTTIIAIGGGVVGDLAGFVAATYTRGVPFVQIPTTLLAQVDSSVGGKVGINHPHAKNLIGAFHQPLGVLIDTNSLQTLPEREYHSGLAEVVKYGVILDADFFNYLELNTNGLNTRDASVLQHVILRGCELKAQVVEQDEFERTGLRAVLNYGHTFAHAYEALAGYGKLLHGEAVSIGMIAASRLAEHKGCISAQETQRQVKLLSALNLPTALPEDVQLDPQEIIDRMKLDKKSMAGQLRFILPTKIGHVELFDDIPESEVLDILQ